MLSRRADLTMCITAQLHALRCLGATGTSIDLIQTNTFKAVQPENSSDTWFFDCWAKLGGGPTDAHKVPSGQHGKGID